MSRRNESLGIFLGLLLLLGLHIVGFSIFVTVGQLAVSLFFSVTHQSSTEAAGWGILLFGITGIWLYQLVYVIPLIRRFKHRQEFGMMKGIIAGAAITALISGPCFVFFVQTLVSGGG